MNEQDKIKLEWIKFGIENFGLNRYSYDINMQALETSMMFERMTRKSFEYPKFTIILNTGDELTFKPSRQESYSEIVKLADCLVNSFTDTFELDCVRARKFVTELKDAIKTATI